jgi:protein-tyrosine-phosphatase
MSSLKQVFQASILIPSIADRATSSAVHSLGRAGYRVATTYSSGGRVPALARDRYVTEIIETPDPAKCPTAYCEWLEKRLVSCSSEYLLPVNEAVIAAAAALRSRGFPADRFILPRDENLQFTLSKFRATEAAEAAGTRVPRTVYLRRPGHGAIDRDIGALPFPVIVKWDNCEDEDGEYRKGSNRIVRNATEFLAVAAELEPSTCGVIAQELVPGYGVGAFFIRQRGKIVLRFAHRRLHEVPWTGGESSLCESSDDVEVLEAGERLLDAINYGGVAMVEFRKEPGKPPVFLEINGRLWGSLGLALAAGADFPRALVECHLHGKTEVRQPNLSRRVCWREPRLEMDYLHSLWERPAGPGAPAVPKFHGTLSVLCNLIDPRSKSGWTWRDGFWPTMRRHLGLWRREAAWLKQTLRRRWQDDALDPLVVECVERTKALLAQAAGNPPRSLLFLCYGNICRSPYAEFRWQQWTGDSPSLPAANSAGFHDKEARPTPARFQSVARHLGVELESHRSKRVSKSMIDAADWIFVMDAANLRALHEEFPFNISKILMLGASDDPEDPVITDPYGGPMGAGAKAYKQIDAALTALKERVAGNL